MTQTPPSGLVRTAQICLQLDVSRRCRQIMSGLSRHVPWCRDKTRICPYVARLRQIRYTEFGPTRYE